MLIAPKGQGCVVLARGDFLWGLLFAVRVGIVTLIDGENDTVLGEELEDLGDAVRDHAQQRVVLLGVQSFGVG